MSFNVHAMEQSPVTDKQKETADPQQLHGERIRILFHNDIVARQEKQLEQFKLVRSKNNAPTTLQEENTPVMTKPSCCLLSLKKLAFIAALKHGRINDNFFDNIICDQTIKLAHLLWRQNNHSIVSALFHGIKMRDNIARSIDQIKKSVQKLSVDQSFASETSKDQLRQLGTIIDAMNKDRSLQLEPAVIGLLIHADPTSLNAQSTDWLRQTPLQLAEDNEDEQLIDLFKTHKQLLRKQ